MATRSGYRQSRRDRKKVEMLFAHFKRILKWIGYGCGASMVRGTSSCSQAIAQNRRRMAKRLCPIDQGQGCGGLALASGYPLFDTRLEVPTLRALIMYVTVI